jgi:hypothetical protein
MDFLRKAALVLIALFLSRAGITAARSRERPSSKAVAIGRTRGRSGCSSRDDEVISA